MNESKAIEPAVEALLLMATEATASITLAEALQVPVEVVDQACSSLADFYTETGRGFELRHVGGGWRLWTRPEHADLIGTWVLSGQHARLSQAALETLAVIAYLQPIARSRVSAVRGVNVDGVVRTLLARGLVEEAGQDERGQAAVLRTTDLFLERMGLESLTELPELAPHLPDATDLEEELGRVAAASRPSDQTDQSQTDEPQTDQSAPEDPR
ncbi:SMC-Scp complex subunit ScpB [Aestuariimicrobium ganziense]|uniref:SMC-Scp complex subunit ScpB n=1 Tax=Aestuariimicrobium ganziense TaxID=2773677 RepID=UPI001941D00D|nr:SMC-Scp complex subunit ScpB [Aestuariimicrobium ganziense]